jgi:hypothetical protein
MSNHEMDLHILAFMAKYVNKEKPFNYYELKGAIDILKDFYDSKNTLSNQITNTHSSDYSFPITETPDTCILSQENSESEQAGPSQEKLSIQKTRRTRNVWSDEFCEAIKSELNTFFKENPEVTKMQVRNHFLKTFEHKLNHKDKICYTGQRPSWNDKLHDNINQWFVKTGICNFVNGTYYFKVSSGAESKQLEKTVEM